MADDQQRHQLFRTEYNTAVADANIIFPGDGETNLRENYLKAKTDELLKKYRFLSGNSNESSSSSTTRIVKNFVDTCNKCEPKTENMAEFFEQLKRKIDTDNISHENSLCVLDILFITRLLFTL